MKSEHPPVDDVMTCQALQFLVDIKQYSLLYTQYVFLLNGNPKDKIGFLKLCQYDVPVAFF